MSGETVSASPDLLTQELAERGLLVQRIRRKHDGLGIRFQRSERIKAEELLLFNQELIALLRAGLTVPDALRLAAERPDQPKLSGILARVLQDVQSGAPFSAACASYPEAFDGLFISAARTGERTGDLVATLGRLQEHLKRRVAVQKKVSQALAYPSFLLITLAVILTVLFVVVMPRFVQMYADVGAQLPLPTRMLLMVVENLEIAGPLALLFGAGAWFGFRAAMARRQVRLTVDRWRERLPLVGELNDWLSTAQFARTLSMLLGGGTPLVEALRATAEAMSNLARAQRLDAATAKVVGGESLAAALGQEKLLPAAAIKMVEVGEASGELDGMLAEVAQFYEERLDHGLARLMAMIEPALMLLVGVLIGGVIITMYLPIFSMAEIIQ